MIEKVRFVLLYLVLVTESVVQTHAAEPSDLAWTRVKGADHWTEVVARAVTAATLPKIVPADVSAFCPPYEQSSTADRSHFWVGLIAAIADAETAGHITVALMNFNRVTLAAYRAMWAQFNPILMSLGLYF